MLRVTLHINDDQIGDYEILNIGQVDGDAKHTYEVREIFDEDRTGPLLFQITHLRELGAEWLAGMALIKLTAIKDIGLDRVTAAEAKGLGVFFEEDPDDRRET